MKTRCIIFLTLCTFITSAFALEKKVVSPDGKLVVIVSDNNGAPTYSVTYNGKQFLKSSPLGMKTNVGDFSNGLTISESVSQKQIEDNYELPNIKQSRVHYIANEAVFSFLKEDKAAFDIVFRVSNNNIAFQYKVFPQGERLVCVVNQETTGFSFPDGSTTFLCPQSKPMVGFEIGRASCRERV